MKFNELSIHLIILEMTFMEDNFIINETKRLIQIRDLNNRIIFSEKFNKYGYKMTRYKFINQGDGIWIMYARENECYFKNTSTLETVYYRPIQITNFINDIDGSYLRYITDIIPSPCGTKLFLVMKDEISSNGYFYDI